MVVGYQHLRNPPVLWEDMKFWNSFQPEEHGRPKRFLEGSHLSKLRRYSGPQSNSHGLTFIRGWDYHFLLKLMSMLGYFCTQKPCAASSKDCKKWQSLGTSFLKVGKDGFSAHTSSVHPQWCVCQKEICLPFWGDDKFEERDKFIETIKWYPSCYFRHLRIFQVLPKAFRGRWFGHFPAAFCDHWGIQQISTQNALKDWLMTLRDPACLKKVQVVLWKRTCTSWSIHFKLYRMLWII